MLSPALAVNEKRVQDRLKKAEHELKQAQEQAKELGNQISHAKQSLDILRGQVAGILGDIEITQKEYDRLAAELEVTLEDRDDTQGELDVVQSAIDDRAREAFESGPSGGLQLLMTATSLVELSERAAFLDALQAQDVNTADQIDVFVGKLRRLAHDQHTLAKDAERALKVVQDKKEQLKDKLIDQNAALDDYNAQLAEAHKLEKKWGKLVVVQQKKLGYAVIGGPGPFYACPVPEYSWIADGFGDVRYTTVPPHPHAGNDIGAAAGADIIAPFDGITKSSYNSLGGSSVYVYGKDGYVYNAHLASFEGSYPRHVDAGEVIGHVGMSGDAQGTVNHDHFEWHPKNIGGVTSYNGAVDPYPYLQEVCHR